MVGSEHLRKPAKRRTNTDQADQSHGPGFAQGRSAEVVGRCVSWHQPSKPEVGAVEVTSGPGVQHPALGIEPDWLKVESR